MRQRRETKDGTLKTSGVMTRSVKAYDRFTGGVMSGMYGMTVMTKMTGMTGITRITKSTYLVTRIAGKTRMTVMTGQMTDLIKMTHSYTL